MADSLSTEAHNAAENVAASEPASSILPAPPPQIDAVAPSLESLKMNAVTNAHVHYGAVPNSARPSLDFLSSPDFKFVASAVGVGVGLALGVVAYFTYVHSSVPVTQ